MTPTTTALLCLPETTDLERRVLAHERVLQALIAYMARTEPRFVDHLRERFVEPMNMVQHEHDHRGTDDYAEEFIRAVMLLGEVGVSKISEPKMTVKQSASQVDRKFQDPGPERLAPQERIEVRERNGIWEVKVDGKFRGDYHQEAHALAAATLLKLSPQ